ncbi:MAG: tetratricopeptide repeat protein [Thermodesulfobacteriota bacterium]|nr:MAG: tetratricopeptide repeat protein [Thermodesulfobacteriota bacterium]
MRVANLAQMRDCCPLSLAMTTSIRMIGYGYQAGNMLIGTTLISFFTLKKNREVTMSNKVRNFMFRSLFVFFFFLYSFASAKENVTDIAKKITPSIVSVTTFDGQGKALSQGNGFFINANGDVITNVHILKNTSRVEIKTVEGKVFPVKGPAGLDKKNGLILFSVAVPQQKAAPLSLSSSVPKAGEKISVISKQVVLNGAVSAVEDIPGAGKILQITAPLSPGLSGSPVANMRGEVIGIAALQTIQGQKRAVVIPNGQIKLKKLVLQKPAEVPSGKQEKPPVTVSPGEDPFVSGMKFLKAARFQQAQPYFEKAVKQNPKNSEAYFYSGLCYGNLSKYKEAIEAFKQAISLKPDFAFAHLNLGVAYSKLGRNNEAIEAFKKAASLKPDAPTYVNLGGAYGSLGRNDEAIEAFKKAISLKADYAAAHNNLGATYVRLGRYHEAAEEYKEAIRLKPNFAAGYLNLGIAHINLGRHDEAIETFKKALSLQPNSAEAHFNLGLAYGSLGRFSDATGAFKEAIRLKPNFALAHLNLGIAYGKLGRNQEAIEAFKKAISLKADYAEAYYNLGSAYGNLDRHKEAIEAFKKAVSLQPNSAGAHFNLGIAYVSINNKDSAQEEYNILKKLSPQQAEELLKAIEQ